MLVSAPLGPLNYLELGTKTS